MKRELILVAVAALLVAHSNSTAQPAASTPNPANNLVEARGPDGAIGTTGFTGAQGSTGAPGEKPAAGIIGAWAHYRDYTFDYNDARLQKADLAKAADIAAHLKANPSLQLALDGTMDPRGADPKNQELSNRRVETVRFALIDAGVPGYKIRTGAYGDPQTRLDRRVEVLIATFK